MERDEETGMAYHTARYYLPWLGRWCSSDPIGIGDGVNVYAYVYNDPINYIDLDGKQAARARITETQLQHLTPLDVQRIIVAGGGTPGPCQESPTYEQRQVDINIARDLLIRADSYGEDSRYSSPVLRPDANQGPSIGPITAREMERDRVAYARTQAEQAATVENLRMLTSDPIAAVLVLPSIGRVDQVTLNQRLRGASAASGLVTAAAAVSRARQANKSLSSTPAPSQGSTVPEASASTPAKASESPTPAAEPKPPLLVQAEVKPIGNEKGGWHQLRQPSRHSAAAIGSVSTGGGYQGVALYDRVSGKVTLKVEEIGKEGMNIRTFNIGQLSKMELGELDQKSGGNTTKFGNLVEPRIRQMISDATGQLEYDPTKHSAKNGVDWRPAQLPLPFAQ